MSLEVQKKERETSQSLVRRFSQRVKRSGILRWVKYSQFYQRPKGRQMQKRAALRREEIKKEYERIKKLGEKLKK
jgi:ribosomal protein S21